jgi:hypothetical protein
MFLATVGGHGFACMRNVRYVVAAAGVKRL